MIVPKAAMHKYHFTPGDENNIGFAGKLLGVQSIPIAHSVNQPPDTHFWVSVRAPNATHAFAALTGIEVIDHVELLLHFFV